MPWTYAMVYMQIQAIGIITGAIEECDIMSIKYAIHVHTSLLLLG